MKCGTTDGTRSFSATEAGQTLRAAEGHQESSPRQRESRRGNGSKASGPEDTPGHRTPSHGPESGPDPSTPSPPASQPMRPVPLQRLRPQDACPCPRAPTGQPCSFPSWEERRGAQGALSLPISLKVTARCADTPHPRQLVYSCYCHKPIF